MVLGDSEYFVLDVFARAPGSLHDARVLQEGALFTLFQNGYKPFEDAVILADSGYPSSLPWLATPFPEKSKEIVCTQLYRA